MANSIILLRCVTKTCGMYFILCNRKCKIEFCEAVFLLQGTAPSQSHCFCLFVCLLFFSVDTIKNNTFMSSLSLKADFFHHYKHFFQLFLGYYKVKKSIFSIYESPRVTIFTSIFHLKGDAHLCKA